MVNPSSTRPIDCDIHPVVPNTRVLLPYLDDYWREHIIRRGLEADNLELSAYPSSVPLNSGLIEPHSTMTRMPVPITGYRSCGDQFLSHDVLSGRRACRHGTISARRGKKDFREARGA